MRKLSIIGLALIFLLIGTVAAWATVTTDNFRYISQMNKVTDDKGFFVVEIDAKVFANMDNSLRDLRIFDKEEAETGFTRINPEVAQEQDRYNELEIINKGVLKNSDIYSFTVQNVPVGVSKMTVKLDSPEYLVKAMLHGSNDNRSWQELGTKTLYGINGKYNSFELTGVDYKYIKFEFRMPKDQTLAVSSVGYTVQQKVNYETKVESFPLNQQQDDKASVLTIDLGSKNQNSRAVKLTCDEKNFYRRAVIESSNDGKQWSYVSDFFIYRGADQTDENLGTQYPPTQARYIRVTVQNEDNVPVRFKEAMVELVPVRILVKGVAEDAPYMVVWGNEQLGYPAYDIEEVMKQSEIALGSLPVINLNSFEDNKEYKQPEIPFTERFPFLLPLALAIAVVVVGVIQYKSFKKVG